MSLMQWSSESTPDGAIFSAGMVDGYNIIQRDGGFFVHRTEDDCDDIGPLEDFKRAEDIIMKIGIALVEFEDKLWRVSAAMAIKVSPIDDGTANQLEDMTP